MGGFATIAVGFERPRYSSRHESYIAFSGQVGA